MPNSYLEHTLSAAGTNGNKKATFSAWLKRSINGAEHVFYTVRQDGNNFMRFRFDSDKINVTSNTSGTNYYATTDALFRDPTAFYHVVVTYDTTQATSSNRIRIYVNGNEQTKSASNYPSQDATLFMIASGQPQRVGQESGGGYFNGVMSHVHYTEGYAYAATDFGEFDSTSGVWVPKTSPSVTYGTNGFFLKFENSGALGTDSSGGSNTFTVNGNLKQNADTPTNNFCTLDFSYYSPSQTTLSNAATTCTASGNAWKNAPGTLGVSSGKWYWEFKVGTYTSSDGIQNYGIVAAESEDLDNATGEFSGSSTISAGGISYCTDGRIIIAGTSTTSWGATFTTGDIVGVALDLDNNKLYFSKNSTYQNSGVPTSGSTGTGAIAVPANETWLPCLGFYGSQSGDANFGGGYFGTTAVASANADANGHGAFEYAVPSGYYALCTKNIKEFG